MSVVEQAFTYSPLLIQCTRYRSYSLVAPVKPHSDVSLDLASLVLGEVTLDQLPTQVNKLIHHMTQLMEQIHLVFLLKEPKKTQLGHLISSCIYSYSICYLLKLIPEIHSY